ncbi:MAG TPA: hypothetical protein VF230_16955 [Acidimicrobiales bacterium]
MLLWLGALVVLLLAVAMLYDLLARRRGRYRTAAEWQAMSKRRKGHLREVRRRRSSDAQNRYPY